MYSIDFCIGCYIWTLVFPLNMISIILFYFHFVLPDKFCITKPCQMLRTVPILLQKHTYLGYKSEVYASYK